VNPALPGTKKGFNTLYLKQMKKILLIWLSLSLALGPAAGAFSSPMPDMAGSETGQHCMGHESADDQPQGMRMDCCDSEYDQNQCCDHCVSHVSGLPNTSFSLLQNSIADPAITFVEPVLSETRSPPYKPPQA
jgi:hypothetical protein